jgi:hypothetical protein
MTRMLSATVTAALLFSAAGAANAAAPKTKAACEKMKSMTWDDATSKCVKK